MTRFQDYLVQHNTAGAKPLPLTHCTSGGIGLDILAELAIRPTHCDVYGADLLYLFYGRPAYKPLQGLGASTLAETAPICLVLDPTVLDAAVRILPFDSGGFERYRPFVGPSLSLPDFELEPNADAPLRLIRAFFETSSNYYVQEPNSALTFAASDREAAAYGRLIADPSICHDDDRRGTIEVQIAAPVSLPDALRALIAPASLMDDPVVLAALTACPQAVALDYRLFGRMAPEGLAYPIYQQVEKFLEQTECFS